MKFAWDELVDAAPPEKFWREIMECLAGALAVGVMTLVCFQLRVQLPTPTLLYLIIIVLLSLRVSFISSAAVSFLAFLCLLYFFASPVFSFKVGNPLDAVAMIVFLLTSAVITQLVSRVRRLMREKLQRNAAYLCYAQQLSHTGSFGWVVSTGEIIWSEQTFRIFQYERTVQPTLELILQRVHPEDTALVKHTIEGAAQKGERFDLEHRLLLPDGSVKYLEVVAHPEKNKSGKLEFIGAVMDVTDRTRSDQALREARANLAHVTRLTTMGELTASIAHEVNQPLAAVVTNANAGLRWLDRETPDLEEARDALRRIIRDGRRGSEVIERIRGLLRKEQPARARLNVNEVVQETLALARMDLQGAALQTDLASTLPEVMADRVQLQQVLLNLTVNAIDAMKPVTDRPRVLRIQTQDHEGRAILIAIQDSGIGLDAKKQGNLFEAFYTTKPKGLGMGLSICRSIVESHGGRLWAESNEGCGTIFRFTLPVGEGGAA